MAYDVFYRRRYQFLLIGTLFMGGCGSLTGQSAPPPPVVTQPLKTVCIPMVPYSAADQNTFADEAEALKQTGKFPQTLRFLGDYKAMRDADRACTGK